MEAVAPMKAIMPMEAAAPIAAIMQIETAIPTETESKINEEMRKIKTTILCI
ncbi:MAG: hypothetical protein HFH91_18040 [Lachnospiraceae bacterium]|nr:hypothetical protein [Lachnospiraceae bacterium]